MAALGSTEILILLFLFFLLFGVERLPKMARAMGQARGEFSQGLQDIKDPPELKQTTDDLDRGGRTENTELVDRAKALGLDPSGVEENELKKRVEALEKTNGDDE